MCVLFTFTHSGCRVTTGITTCKVKIPANQGCKPHKRSYKYSR